MAFVASARHIPHGLAHRHQVPSRRISAGLGRTQSLCRRSPGHFKLRTSTNTFLRWTAPKPGRGGRLTILDAHSAIPEAAGLFNPASDKVYLRMLPAQHASGLLNLHRIRFLYASSSIEATAAAACHHLHAISCFLVRNQAFPQSSPPLLD